MTSIDDPSAFHHHDLALVGPPRALEGSWDRAEWQRLWLGTQVRPWRTLALVPGDRGTSTFEAASLITALGLHYGESIGMADVRDVRLNRVTGIIEFTSDIVASGLRVVFAARAITENLATIPIARSADCVLLCASLGSTSVALVEETIAQFGKERFLGSLLLKHGRDGPALSIIPRRTHRTARSS